VQAAQDKLKMSQDKTAFNQMVLLTGARIFGILFSIAIPMFLGRKLSIEMYGTYKQIMLFYWFSQVALNLGVDDSAYYYFKWEPKNLSLFSFNALIFNTFVTSTIWIFLICFKSEIAHFLANPDLANYLALMGFLIFATVCSMQIEGILIVGLNRFNDRLKVEMATELLKSLAIISAFYFYNSLYVAMSLLIAIMCIRLVAVMLIINHCRRKEKLSFFDGRKLFVKQLKFGLPLGLSRVLQNILNMENFYISHFFSLIQFTFYSVGCFENPLINAARTSVFELTHINMIDAVKNGSKEKALEVWRSSFRKLFLIIVPFITYMMFFGHEIITFIFSDKYKAAVPFFIIFNVFLFVGALNPEPIFRATSKTHLALKIKVIGLVIGVFLLVLGAHFGGPIYALVGKIAGVFIMNIIGLVIGAKLLETQFRNLFKWDELAKVIIVSTILAFGIRIWFWNIQSLKSVHVFWTLAYSFSSYFVLHFFFSCKINLIKDDEINYLKIKILRILRIKNDQTELVPIE
jgi:O-antigen/teichoic acid export membrane protein